MALFCLSIFAFGGDGAPLFFRCVAPPVNIDSSHLRNNRSVRECVTGSFGIIEGRPLHEAKTFALCREAVNLVNSNSNLYSPV